MHLPTKVRPHHIFGIIVTLLLLALSFTDFTEYILVYFCRQLRTNPRLASNETRDLKRTNLVLSLKLKQLKYLKDENEKLKKILHFNEGKNLTLIETEIIAYDPSAWKRIITVNGGTQHGLSEGLYAVNEEGSVIGKIVDTKKTYSRLMLVDDPNFEQPVSIGDNAFGLLKGTLGGVKILYIENPESIAVNDKIWFKLAQTDIPLAIGEVARIRNNPDELFLDVDVRLYTKTPLIHRLFIIKTK